jgi:hypothetical protein
MKLLKQHIAKDGSGSVTLQPEEPEDMGCNPFNICWYTEAPANNIHSGMHTTSSRKQTLSELLPFDA